jgi:hypothetical protein
VADGFENRYLHRDGSVRWLRWTSTFVDDAKHVYAAAVHVTDLKESEQRLRSSEERLERGEELTELGMHARYHRDRHRLYAARMGGSRPWSLSKLRELKRMREVAESALRRAKERQREVDDRP